MTSSEDYCELCDLPLSQCVHGRPPTPPAEKPAPAAARTTTRTSRTTSRTTTRAASPTATGRATVSSRPPRRTPQREFRRHILGALQDSGGRADVEDLMAEVARRMEEVLRPADHETVNQGELRWRYAARLERRAMQDEGLMVPPSRPGLWELSDAGLTATD
ncbi:hypothetical protein [Nocardioides panaciterrulae]|uniref:Restriction system protein Mrr-like N-terminal domain-containing protein n=1 Tax=Nocardioides panaciterrulae TaxID=661492 RepID=A0A7Y9E8H3_9ACTN|nr:hypothetical protein [Nocardioides panaciterrulae]NYD43166.1 hypothetical protein [Nocardioides panaciterrulae]